MLTSGFVLHDVAVFEMFAAAEKVVPASNVRLKSTSHCVLLEICVQDAKSWPSAPRFVIRFATSPDVAHTFTGAEKLAPPSVDRSAHRFVRGRSSQTISMAPPGSTASWIELEVSPLVGANSVAGENVTPPSIDRLKNAEPPGWVSSGGFGHNNSISPAVSTPSCTLFGGELSGSMVVVAKFVPPSIERAKKTPLPIHATSMPPWESRAMTGLNPPPTAVERLMGGTCEGKVISGKRSNPRPKPNAPRT